MTLHRPHATVAVALVMLALASNADAQSNERFRREASFTAGASLGDGETAPALSAGLGIGFSHRLGLNVELAYARKLDFTLDLCPAPRVCVLGGQLPVTGRTVSLTPHLVVDLLPRSRRGRVYAQFGVGAGHLRQRYFVSPFSSRVESTRSSLVAALSFGAGATIPIASRFALGADVRVLQLFDERAAAEPFIAPSGTLSTIRVGSRLAYRF